MTSKMSQMPSASSSTRRSDVSRDLTREHISEHLAAFRAAGGVVEVLGNTPIHRSTPPSGKSASKSAPRATTSPPAST
ncbi:hypothetical protein DWG18_07455 [Lysobacter sp. TY2-98]|uniref:hypothetical protein n=1 Tax=Lysobacter sp. TY2-98 TaxID=2290922 RepID=UPI000E1FF66B|nr:hypothetical protein [Lysobacter sp. TY2-98]AXK72133.1 hypothetical protein DWG18_07455 [Lysobacter sp. TY2-98]